MKLLRDILSGWRLIFREMSQDIRYLLRQVSR